MADSSLALVHSQWLDLLGDLFEKFDKKLADLRNISPKKELVFANFSLPPTDTKVLILGQDPYPTLGDAMGLAFSSRATKLPKSLKNIFTELYDDIGGSLRKDGDLSDWHNQGVSLMNVILTTEIGKSLAHQNFGWNELTESAISILANNGVIPLLMGKPAAKYAPLFPKAIVTAHPSPLSAHRGFFGSKPFSKINDLLESEGKSAIKW